MSYSSLYSSLTCSPPLCLAGVGGGEELANEDGDGDVISRKESTEPDLMEYSQLLTWLPDDRDLPSYLRSQRVHHERRVRWNSSLLNRLGGIAATAAD